MSQRDCSLFVIPAEAGIQCLSLCRVQSRWIPAFAGMTSWDNFFRLLANNILLTLHHAASARFLRSSSCKIIGVKISSIARPIFPPGATIVFGRLMNESCSMLRR